MFAYFDDSYQTTVIFLPVRIAEENMGPRVFCYEVWSEWSNVYHRLRPRPGINITRLLGFGRISPATMRTHHIWKPVRPHANDTLAKDQNGRKPGCWDRRTIHPNSGTKKWSDISTDSEANGGGLDNEDQIRDIEPRRRGTISQWARSCLNLSKSRNYDNSGRTVVLTTQEPFDRPFLIKRG